MTSRQIIVFCIPFALLLATFVAWLFLRKTIRTRLRTEKQLRDDPDITEWLVVFNWSRKILFLPIIAVSLVCWLLMLLYETWHWGWINPEAVGGVWLAVFFVNFLIDEYQITIRVLLMFVVLAVAAALWLTLLDWLRPFLNLFGRLNVALSSEAYLIFALILLAAIAVSWIKGLFYYIAITPNAIDIKTGPTDTGEQIAREQYGTRVETGDFIERIMGFGTIIVTFADNRRPPMLMMVGRIGAKAKALESVRGKIVVDRHQGPGVEDKGIS